MNSATGAFHGTMIATTPTGSATLLFDRDHNREDVA
jgi:hypothetical protein